MKKNKNLLKELQKIINEAKKENCNMPVRVDLETDFIDSEDPLFKVFCEGELYSDFLSYEEAKNTLQTLIKGMQIASYLTVHTTAGILSAYKSTDSGRPGISVMLLPAGYKEEVDTTCVNVVEDAEFQTEDKERPEDVVIHTFGDIYTTDETSKNIIRKEDVKTALSL